MSKQDPASEAHNQSCMMQRVVELDEAGWASLRSAVVHRLKKLMTGVADPSRLARDRQAREQQAAAAAKHKAEASRQRQLERQR